MALPSPPNSRGDGLRRYCGEMLGDESGFGQAMRGRLGAVRIEADGNAKDAEKGGT